MASILSRPRSPLFSWSRTCFKTCPNSIGCDHLIGFISAGAPSCAGTARPNPAYRPPEAGRTSLLDDRVSMPVATLYAKRTRPGRESRPCRCGLSERDFGLDHFQFGGHDLALGFRP